MNQPQEKPRLGVVRPMPEKQLRILIVTVEEIVVDWTVRRLRWLRGEAVPNVFRLVAAIFPRALEAIERGLYAVDEFVRIKEAVPAK